MLPVFRRSRVLLLRLLQQVPMRLLLLPMRSPGGSGVRAGAHRRHRADGLRLAFEPPTCRSAREGFPSAMRMITISLIASVLARSVMPAFLQMMILEPFGIALRVQVAPLLVVHGVDARNTMRRVIRHAVA